VSEPCATLRRFVAAEHRLPEGSAVFLRGETLEEVERSAVEFAQLFREGRDQERAVGKPGPFFADMVAAKARRKEALAELLTGRASLQPRDARGRWTGFDGGARQPAPTRGSPEREHNELVSELTRVSRTFRS
jgi:hypothetical protein